MRKSLQSVQAFSAHLSINVVSEDEKGVNFSTMNLVNLATLLMFVWHIQMIPNRIGFEIMTMFSDILHALVVAGTVLEIGLNSLAWGMLNV